MRESDDQVFRAVVVVPTDTGASIQRDGSITTEGPYTTMGLAALAENDEVICLRVGTGYVIIGKLLR